jgi:NAD(P)-dependent dehydrogenase (short-subunit alcohol dehydrogenase family)
VPGTGVNAFGHERPEAVTAFSGSAAGKKTAPMSQVVVITGGSAGVGRAVAQRFARRGARLGLLARGQERLEAAATEVEKSGGTALAVPTDVADAEAVDDAAERIERDLGPIDVWVNNAMATIFAPFHEIEPDEYRRATETTYLGTVWGTLSALRRMRPRNRGTIVFVGSALAYRGIPLQAPYCGAKHAVKGFFESVRTELIHDGSAVRTTMVQLPAHNTPQFSWGRTRMPRHPQPVPPIFEPEVAAEAIEYAAIHAPRQLLVGWPTVKAIAGNAVAPGLIDRYLASHAYDAQQTPDPVDDDRPDNLFAPAPGDYASHGVFDREAKRSSALLRVRLALGRLASG